MASAASGAVDTAGATSVATGSVAGDTAGKAVAVASDEAVSSVQTGAAA